MQNHLRRLGLLVLAGSALAAFSAAPVRAQSWLAAGFDHVCGLTASGEAYCWGSNHSGQIGNGIKDTLAALPVKVTGGQSLVALASGLQRTCGLTAAGAAYCWGMNQWGALGDGSTTDHLQPAAVV